MILAMTKRIQKKALNIPIFNPHYVYIRARQWEGTFPGPAKIGAWIVTGMRVMYALGDVCIEDWSEVSQSWPPTVPDSLDRLAKPYRIKYYERLRNSQECAIALSKKAQVLVAVEVTRQWLTTPDGVIRSDDHDQPVIGTHGFALLDTHGSVFSFMNSWPDWGNNGRGEIPFEYIDARLVESWAHPRIFDPAHRVFSSEPRHRCYVSLRGDFIHIFEVGDSTLDERIAWSFATIRDGWLDVDELFVRAAHRRRGHGSQLFEAIQRFAKSKDLRIRVWISFADCHTTAKVALESFLAKFQLHLVASDVRWAGYVAVAERTTSDESPQVRIPDAPALAITKELREEVLSMQQTNVRGPSGSGEPSRFGANQDAFPSVGSAEWGEMNRRRLALIDKQLDGNLTEKELVELERLQRKSLEEVNRVYPLPKRNLNELGRLREELKAKTKA